MKQKPRLNKFFVYGTLRPDVKAPWSELVHNNPKFKITSYKSYLSHSKLFMNNTIGYPVCIYDEEKFNEHDTTIGYLLVTDNINETLKLLDHIECYPNEYDRIIVKCLNYESGEIEKAYFYTANKNTFKMEELSEMETNDFAKLK